MRPTAAALHYDYWRGEVGEETTNPLYFNTLNRAHRAPRTWIVMRKSIVREYTYTVV